MSAMTHGSQLASLFSRMLQLVPASSCRCYFLSHFLETNAVRPFPHPLGAETARAGPTSLDGFNRQVRSGGMSLEVRTTTERIKP